MGMTNSARTDPATLTAHLATYLVTDAAQCAAAGRTVAQTVQLAVRGGVTCVQLRAKEASVKEILREIEAVLAVLPPSVPLILNDRVDVYQQAVRAGLNVAGVHIGLRDGDPVAVRKLIGSEAILGLSVGSVEQIERYQHSAVDYFGIGPVRDTSTKIDAPPGMGFDAFASLVEASKLPVVAIGGMAAADTRSVVAGGGAGLALVSAICASRDPQQAAGQLRGAWLSATSLTTRKPSDTAPSVSVPQGVHS